MAIPLAILVLGGLLQSRVRADPELSAAIDTIPRNRQAVQAVLAVGAVVLGLLAISIGHVLHWERGTEDWGPAFDGTSGWLKQWTTHPSALLFHVGGSVGDVNPIVWLEKSFTLSSTSAGVVPPFLLIGFGILLLAIGISAAIRVPSRSEASRRAWHLGLEISSYVLGALVVLWVGAPIAALRMETTFNGIEQRVESEQPFEVAETRIRQVFLQEGLQIDIEQHLRIDDQASGDVVAHARVYRAQAPSPFDRWSTSFRGPQRESPQIWATLVEHQSGVGSTIVLRGGLYDAASDEIVRARDAVRRIHGALVKL
jgi:hypothetical protein